MLLNEVSSRCTTSSKLSVFLNYKGHDAVHTLDLVNKNRSKDSETNTLSLKEQKVVVSKDMDFVASLLIADKPYKLLSVNAANINNKQLQVLFSKNLEQIVLYLEDSRLVELTQHNIIVHG